MGKNGETYIQKNATDKDKRPGEVKQLLTVQSAKNVSEKWYLGYNLLPLMKVWTFETMIGACGKKYTFNVHLRLLKVDISFWKIFFKQIVNKVPAAAEKKLNCKIMQGF